MKEEELRPSEFQNNMIKYIKNNIAAGFEILNEVNDAIGAPRITGPKSYFENLVWHAKLGILVAKEGEAK